VGGGVRLGPLVRRLTAPNPSPYTSTGTQTYLVGTDEVAVIDPGPDAPDHLARIVGEVGDGRIVAILCTHTHRDHSPASRPLQGMTGAPIVGCAPIVPAGRDAGRDTSFDLDYRPDRVMADGDVLRGEGWSLQAIATPGHTSNHLCFALPEARALFSGDHVMGWSTSVVIPPDGDMGDYMASLDRLIGRPEQVYYPGHGEPVERPQRYVAALAGHRRQREGQIVRRLQGGPAQVTEMVDEMYAGLDTKLRGAARHSVLAHLLDLEERGRVMRDGDRWRAAA
jgi:glyoxylase-like metal-dependent hydrolase (beta-lactamase superfamily II)